ncbi:hypothetical protein DL93DRAFT_2169674 [Clavulina sp. PMI_390]|nr:hypothetical protein DL93DRAFT_2169674 [Clavulina sp. PMI_390]
MLPSGTVVRREGNIHRHSSTKFSLPDELLGEVFVLLYNSVERDGPYTRVTTYDTSLILSHTCRQWRRVAIHISKLWGFFALRSFKQKDLLYLFLSRLGESRARVRLLASCWSVSTTTLRIDLSQAPQIAALELEHGDLMDLISLSQDARALFHLDAFSVRFNPHGNNRIPKAFMQTRKLTVSRPKRMVHFDDTDIRVTDLCVKATALFWVWDLLKSLRSSINTLELRDIHGVGYDPPFLAPNLTSLSLSHCSPPVWKVLPTSFECPSLRSLSVTLCDRQFHPMRGDQRAFRDFMLSLLRRFPDISSLHLIMSSMRRVADVLEVLRVGKSDTSVPLAPRLEVLEARRPDSHVDGYCERCEPTPETIALLLDDTESSPDEDFNPDDDDEDGDDKVPSSQSLPQADDLLSSGGVREEASNDSDDNLDKSDSDSDAYSNVVSEDDQFFSLPGVDPPPGIDFSPLTLPSATFDILEPRIRGPLGSGLESLLTTICLSRSLVDPETEAAYKECAINLKIIEEVPGRD